jgi:hypothetical protein
MVRIAADDELYGEFRSKSFEFRDRFDGRSVAKEFEGVYQELIERHS